MSAHDDLERRIADFYASDVPTRAPDRVLGSVLDSIDDTNQRRVLIRAPWRFPNMNSFAKVAVAAVVVIAVGAVGLSVLGPGTEPGPGGPPGPSPSPSASPSPSPSPSLIAKALTETFTSERYGFSISYPTGWATRPATDPWTTSFPDFGSTSGDVIYDPVLQDHLWIMVASQPLAGKTATQWLDDLLAGIGGAGICGEPTEPVTIDGTQGRLCGASAATSAGDRGYLITLYTSGDDPAAVAEYDQAYFRQILATMQLTPEDAVDASPSASS
jgi:hypothetical protein